jgi:hypothetical protein
MPTYTPDDDGKVVEGRTVVFLDRARDAVSRSLPRTAAAEREELAALQAATLTAAAEKGVPFCAECEQAKRELARQRGEPS